MKTSFVSAFMLALLLPAVSFAVVCPTLSLGSTGPAVSAVQQVLYSAYQQFPSPTGYFGPTTQAAVKQWQGEHGIEQLGIVGPKTAAAMKISLCSLNAVSPSTAPSNTNVADLIKSLLAQVAVLQAKIAVLKGQTSATVVSPPVSGGGGSSGGGVSTTSGGGGSSNSSSSGGGGSASGGGGSSGGGWSVGSSTTVTLPAPPSSYASLNAAVNAIGPIPTTFLISSPLPVFGTLTVPATLKIVMQQGGSLVKSGSASLTINGSFTADPHTIFSGFAPKDITFGGNAVSEVRPEWWGLSASAAPSVNTDAAQAAIMAGIGVAPVKFGAGTFVVSGRGTPTNLNGAALIVNAVNDPQLLPVTLEGSGVGQTILKMAPDPTNDLHSPAYNIFEALNGTNNDIFRIPITIENISFDGNQAQERQKIAGDRYQNCIYLANISGVTIRNVDCYGGTYHGLAANAVTDSDIQITVHDNVGDGVLITGNDAAGIYGERTTYHITSYNNGIPRVDNYDKPMDPQTGVAIACPDTTVCEDADTYFGVYAAMQRNIDLDITSSGQRWAAALDINRTSGSRVNLMSRNDYVGGIVVDQRLENNTITADIRNGGKALYDHNTIASTSVSGNNFVITSINNGQIADLGHQAGSFNHNTLSGSFINLPVLAQGALMVIGPNFSNNTIENFTAGDQQNAGNVAFFVQVYPNSGGSNIFRNGTLVGNFTTVPFSHLAPSDTVSGIAASQYSGALVQ